MVSEHEARNLRLERLTEWEMANKPILTEWGPLTYREWCVREAMRIEQAKPAEAVIRQSGECSVWASKD